MVWSLTTPAAKRTLEAEASLIPAKIRLHHHPAKLLKRRLRLPVELFLRLCRIPDQEIDLGGAVKMAIDLHHRLTRRSIDSELLLVLSGELDIDFSGLERHPTKSRTVSVRFVAST